MFARSRAFNSATRLSRAAQPSALYHSRTSRLGSTHLQQPLRLAPPHKHNTHRNRSSILYHARLSNFALSQQSRWQGSRSEEQYRRFEEEFGEEPQFMQKVNKEARKGAIIIALLALLPLVLLPYYMRSLDEDRLENGLEALKEYEEYRKAKAEHKAKQGHGDPSVDGEAEVVVTAAQSDDDDEELSTAKHFKYILVGAGTSSFYALRAIREKDPDAKVLIIGDEDMVPYRRPPLSKDLWRSDDPDVAENLNFKSWDGEERSIMYMPEEWYNEDNNITFLKGLAVRDLDMSKKEIALEDGRSFSYSKCLIATGGTPMQIPGCTPDIAHRVSTFRTVADFRNLDSILRQEGGKIAVVGGSFLGTELTAAIASRKGRSAQVVQVFPEPGVMARNLPRYLSEFITNTLKERGVNILNDSVVEHVSRAEDGRVAVHLDNGSEMVVDHLVLAIGISPNTELAEKAGLEIDPRHGGIVANAELEARRGIYVAGDVASYHDTVLGRRRIEHHDHSTSSGRRAGLNMSSGNPRPYTHLPMFWSDVGDIGYEAVGNIDSSLDTIAFWDTINVSQSGSLWSFAAAPVRVGGYHKGVVYYLRDRRVVGVLLWNVNGKVTAARDLIKSKNAFENPEVDLRDKIKFD